MQTQLAKPTRQDPGFFTSAPARRPRVAGIVDWLFGPSPAARPADGLAHTEPYAAPDVHVAPPAEGTVWIEGFFNALTEATTLFAKRHVELVHQEDPSTVYSVREVKIECRDAPSQFHRDVLSLPALVRNRVVKSRMQKAPGAECLLLNDFFGSTIATDITLLEGQMVQTMVSYSGSRFVLKFAFEGEYVTRPDAFEDAVAAEPEPCAPSAPPTPFASSSGFAPYAPAAAAASPLQRSGDGAAVRAAPPFAAQVPEADDLPALRETMLRSRESGAALQPVQDRATPLQQPAASEPPPVALLRLRSLGEEVTLPLAEDNFPYSIGRHAGFRGYCVRGQRDNHTAPLLGDAEQPEFRSFVSREHIVLDSFDPTMRQFRVVATKGRNGSYFRNSPMPSHFLLPLAMMAKGDWLRLGGMNGDGILELRIEAV